MTKYLIKCFFSGLAGFAVMALIAYLAFFFWPYTGYVLAAVVFGGFCIGLGSDLLASNANLGPGR